MTRPRRQADLLEFVDATHVRLGRHTFLYFGGCNYLGLSFEPSVRLAMQRVLERGPVQPGASRATTGDHWLYRQAEQVMARWFRVPVALLVNSGYLAPLAAVQALAVRCTHLLVDDRSLELMTYSGALQMSLTRRIRGFLTCKKRKRKHKK